MTLRLVFLSVNEEEIVLLDVVAHEEKDYSKDGDNWHGHREHERHREDCTSVTLIVPELEVKVINEVFLLNVGNQPHKTLV